MDDAAGEIEQDRQQALERQAPEAFLFEPGTLGCHEALHMASRYLEHIDADLVEHPAIMLRSDWYRMAREVHSKLFDLYQAIGKAHL